MNNKVSLNITTLSNYRKSILSVIMLAVSALILLPNSSRAGMVYTGNIFAQENDQGKILQTHQHTTGLSLSQKITNYSTLNEYIRYSYSWAETLRKTETINQGVDFITANPLFRGHLSAFSNFNLGSEQGTAIDSNRYETGIKSNWKQDRVPGIEIVASKTDSSPKSPTGESSDKEERDVHAGLDWERESLALSYNYNWSQEDPQGASFGKTDNAHSAEARYANYFWDKKLGLKITNTFSATDSEIDIRTTGIVDLPVFISVIRTGFDNIPTDSFESVTDNGQMSDGDRSTVAYNVTSNSSFNNILLGLNKNTADKVYLYTATNLGINALVNLTFNLYSNDILGTPWNNTGIDQNTISYNVIEQRFEIPLNGLSVDYLKIVLDISSSGSDIGFTEVEVFDSVQISQPGQSLRKSRNNQTQIGLNLKINDNVSARYQTSFYTAETETTSSIADTNELNQSASVNYRSTDQTFTSRFTYSNFLRKEENRASRSELESNSYSLDLDKYFLPTLFAGIGIDKTETFNNSVLISENLSFRLDGNAELYPDLSMNFQLLTSESESSFFNNSNNENLNAALSLISRIKPETTVSIRGNHTETTSAASETKRNELNMILNWHISEDLITTAGFNYATGTLTDDEWGYNAKINLALTRILLLEIQYAARESAAKTESGQAELTWSPRNGVRLNAGCDYSSSSTAGNINEFKAFGRAVLSFHLP